jgi:hypothetical protein
VILAIFEPLFFVAAAEQANACTGFGGTVLHKLDEDVTELLEYDLSSFKVVQVVRPRFSFRDLGNDRAAAAASFSIEWGRAYRVFHSN